jgi:hypothetical protein
MGVRKARTTVQYKKKGSETRQHYLIRAWKMRENINERPHHARNNQKPTWETLVNNCTNNNMVQPLPPMGMQRISKNKQ